MKVGSDFRLFLNSYLSVFSFLLMLGFCGVVYALFLGSIEYFEAMIAEQINRDTEVQKLFFLFVENLRLALFITFATFIMLTLGLVYWHLSYSYRFIRILISDFVPQGLQKKSLTLNLPKNHEFSHLFKETIWNTQNSSRSSAQ